MKEEEREIDQFFKNNEVRVGEDFHLTPPVYYKGFQSALYHYFSTFRPKKDVAHFYLDFKTNSRESLALYSDIFNTKHCINACQNFIELFLKSLLSKVLSRAKVRRIIGFDKILGKVNELIDDKTISKDYDFLLTSFNLLSMKKVNNWRNKMTHNGSILINLHGLDYLVSQRMIPLFLEIIAVDLNQGIIKEVPPYTKTYSGIDILSRIDAIKFNISDFEDEGKEQDLWFDLGELYQLKELGRATLNNRLVVKQNGSFSWFESYYDDPQDRNEAFALLEKNNKDFHSLGECPCCGVKSMVVYKKMLNKKISQLDHIAWITCYTCTYGWKDNMGDPYIWGVFINPIFPE